MRGGWEEINWGFRYISTQFDRDDAKITEVSILFIIYDEKVLYNPFRY